MLAAVWPVLYDYDIAKHCMAGGLTSSEHALYCAADYGNVHFIIKWIIQINACIHTSIALKFFRLLYNDK